MTKRHRRKFTDEFKAETVKLIRTSGRSIGSVARELNMGETLANHMPSAEQAVGLPD